MDRRSVLHGALVLGAGVVAGTLAACAPTDTKDIMPSHTPERDDLTTAPAQAAGSRILLAYFSRPGENYHYGDRIDLKVGNTQVVAGMISRATGADVYRIEAADPYPDDYDATVARNAREQREDARPAIATTLPSLADYGTILLGSPIWNVQEPMIMRTFVESFDLTGTTIHPFVTYAVSGMGGVERDYTRLCPGAALGEGLAVQGEEAGHARRKVEAWLRDTGLLTA